MATTFNMLNEITLIVINTYLTFLIINKNKSKSNLYLWIFHKYIHLLYGDVNSKLELWIFRHWVNVCVHFFGLKRVEQPILSKEFFNIKFGIVGILKRLYLNFFSSSRKTTFLTEIFHKCEENNKITNIVFIVTYKL